MNVEIRTTSHFRKEAKKLLKKYPSFKNELIDLNKKLLTNPTFGTPLGNNYYKIRIAIKSKGKGKSGGAIIITNLIFTISSSRIYLITVYDKSKYTTISDIALKRLIKEMKESKK